MAQIDLHRRSVESVISLPKPFHASAEGFFFFGSGTKYPEKHKDENEGMESEEETPEEIVIDFTEEEVAAAVAEAAALPVLDLPIAREGLTENHFVVPDRREFMEAQTRDTELQLLRS